MLLGLGQIGVGLPLRMLGQRQGELRHLLTPCFALGQRRAGLGRIGPPFGVIDFNEQLPGRHQLALTDWYAGDPATDLAGQFDALWRTHLAAGNHRLAQFTLADRQHRGFFAKPARDGEGSEAASDNQDGENDSETGAGWFGQRQHAMGKGFLPAAVVGEA